MYSEFTSLALSPGHAISGSWWTGPAFAVVGLAGALAGIIGTALVLRDRGTNRILKGVVRNYLPTVRADAEEARLQELKELVDRLQVQIEYLPSEAQRLYLTHRADTLRRLLAEQWADYQRVMRDLEMDHSAPELDPLLREALRNTMMPEYRQRVRRERTLSALVVVAVLLLVLPYNAQPFRLIYGYFNSIYYPTTYGLSQVLVSVILGALFVALCLAGVVRLPWLRPLRVYVERRRLGLLVGAALLVIFGLAALIVGASWGVENMPTGQFYSSGVGGWSIVATISLALGISLVTVPIRVNPMAPRRVMYGPAGSKNRIRG